MQILNLQGHKCFANYAHRQFVKKKNFKIIDTYCKEKIRNYTV